MRRATYMRPARTVSFLARPGFLKSLIFLVKAVPAQISQLLQVSFRHRVAGMDVPLRSVPVEPRTGLFQPKLTP